MRTVQVQSSTKDETVRWVIFVFVVWVPLAALPVEWVYLWDRAAGISLLAAVVLAPFVRLYWIRWRAFNPVAEEVDAETEARVNAAFAKRR